MRNTVIYLGIIILISLLSACASNSERGVNSQAEQSQQSSSTAQDNKARNSTWDEGYRY